MVFGADQARLLIVTIQFLLLFSVAIAQDTGCGNVTVASAEDAARISRNCRVVEGNITFAPTLSESLNLDGVETVKGNLGTWPDTGLSRPPAAFPLAISMPSLRAVEGNLYMGTGPPDFGVIEMPRLASVGRSVVFTGYSLERIDITNLARVGEQIFILADRLRNVSHLGLQEVTRASGNPFRFEMATTSIDSFIGAARVNISSSSRPFGGIGDEIGEEGSSLFLGDGAMPNIRHFSIGWTDCSAITVRNWDYRFRTNYTRTADSGITVTLGSGSAAPMRIGSFGLGEDVVGLNRSSPDIHLSAKKFWVLRTNLTSLTVPFNKLGKLEVNENDNLTSVELLPSVTDGMELDSLDIDGAGISLKSWSWPKQPMSQVIIHAKIDEEFFRGFLEASQDFIPTKTGIRFVYENFTVVGAPGSNFSCTPFDQLSKAERLPPSTRYWGTNYLCIEDESQPPDTRRPWNGSIRISTGAAAATPQPLLGLCLWAMPLLLAPLLTSLL